MMIRRERKEQEVGREPEADDIDDGTEKSFFNYVEWRKSVVFYISLS